MRNIRDVGCDVPKSTFITAGEQIFSWDLHRHFSFTVNTDPIRNGFDRTEGLRRLKQHNTWGESFKHTLSRARACDDWCYPARAAVPLISNLTESFTVRPLTPRVKRVGQFHVSGVFNSEEWKHTHRYLTDDFIHRNFNTAIMCLPTLTSKEKVM